jgi:hypothetical protein
VTDFFDRLAARAAGASWALRPRPRSRFESPPNAVESLAATEREAPVPPVALFPNPRANARARNADTAAAPADMGRVEAPAVDLSSPLRRSSARPAATISATTQAPAAPAPPTSTETAEWSQMAAQSSPTAPREFAIASLSATSLPTPGAGEQLSCEAPPVFGCPVPLRVDGATGRSESPPPQASAAARAATRESKITVERAQILSEPAAISPARDKNAPAPAELRRCAASAAGNGVQPSIAAEQAPSKPPSPLAARGVERPLLEGVAAKPSRSVEMRAAPQRDLIVEVTVGRLEIRADPAPPAPARANKPFHPYLDLDAYRAKRDRGR